MEQTKGLSLARGNGDHTNWHARTQKRWKLSWLACGNMSLPIICYLSRLPLFLVFIMQGMCCGGRVGCSEGPFILGLQSAKTPRDRGWVAKGGGEVGKGGNRTEEKCVQQICSPIAFLSLGSIFFVFQKCWKDGCSTLSSVLYMCREKVSVFCNSVLAALPHKRF